jgi:deazaflavin-dependent oxidoreductase (nitroreductase family)
MRVRQPRRREERCGYGRHVSDWDQKVIEEFRANDGRVGGNFEGRTLLLLHHIGAKSGNAYINPLAYQRLSDDSVAIFASKGGAPTAPGWYYNLLAHPDVTVEIGTGAFAAHARVAEGAERETIWERQKQAWPGFATYEEQTQGIREIPVVVLDLEK